MPTIHWYYYNHNHSKICTNMNPSLRNTALPFEQSKSINQEILTQKLYPSISLTLTDCSRVRSQTLCAPPHFTLHKSSLRCTFHKTKYACRMWENRSSLREVNLYVAVSNIIHNKWFENYLTEWKPAMSRSPLLENSNRSTQSKPLKT